VGTGGDARRAVRDERGEARVAAPQLGQNCSPGRKGVSQTGQVLSATLAAGAVATHAVGAHAEGVGDLGHVQVAVRVHADAVRRDELARRLALPRIAEADQ